MTSIVPIAYLSCLSLILTPITILLVLQVISFNKKQFNLLQLMKKNQDALFPKEEKYRIAQIYISNKSWLLALILLEDELHTNSHIPIYWEAKYNNAIGFILQHLNYTKLAVKYYKKAHDLCPGYIYAKQNLDKLTGYNMINRDSRI
jgi:tetratricopeptide (TPR) repeat protein